MNRKQQQQQQKTIWQIRRDATHKKLLDVQHMLIIVGVRLFALVVVVVLDWGSFYLCNGRIKFRQNLNISYFVFLQINKRE